MNRQPRSIPARASSDRPPTPAGVIARDRFGRRVGLFSNAREAVAVVFGVRQRHRLHSLRNDAIYFLLRNGDRYGPFKCRTSKASP